MDIIAKLTPQMVKIENSGNSKSFPNSSNGRELLIQYLTEIGMVDTYHDTIKPVWEAPKNATNLHISNIREDKRAYIKQYCHNLIVSGVSCDVGLVNDDGSERGKLHYSLTERKQADMRDIMDLIRSGYSRVTWRDDSRVHHEVYTSDQFSLLYKCASDFILSCRFHSDALELLLDSYGDDIDKINSLNWETDIPSEIACNIEELLSIMTSN